MKFSQKLNFKILSNAPLKLSSDIVVLVETWQRTYRSFFPLDTNQEHVQKTC